MEEHAMSQASLARLVLLTSTRWRQDMRSQMVFVPGLAVLVAMTLAPATAGQSIRYVDDDAPSGLDGTNWNSAYNDLQYALGQAEVSGGAIEQIWVAEGVYRPDSIVPGREQSFTLVNGVAIYGGFPNRGGEWSERDPLSHFTLLSGDLAGDDLSDFANNDENSHHVVASGAGIDESAILDGFFIMGGNADVWTGAHDSGAGMYVAAQSGPTVRKCVFNMNNSSNHGGGIYTDGSPSIVDCLFVRNRSEVGGGLYADSESAPTLVNCVFYENEAWEPGGGAYTNESDATMTNCVFSRNHAGTASGALGNYGLGTVTLINCTFSANSAPAGRCGGISNYGGANPTLVNCILWGNSDVDLSPGLPQIDNGSGSAATVEYSCIQDWTGGGPGNISEYPQFVAKPDPGADGKWGGSDDDPGDLRLRSNSPCVDAGRDSAVPAGVTTDPDGASRIVNRRVDMGAYEYDDPDDTDGDGVPDGCDDCPDTADDDPVDADGCSTADDDGDGVLNDQDDCAGTPGCADVDADGCPSDSDGDGVEDGCDDCADTPSCATNVDANGCAIDSDGDGNVDGCEPPRQTCCGTTGPVAPLGLAVGMLLLGRFVRRRR
jgi:predicted outer membrane repeat protein